MGRANCLLSSLLAVGALSLVASAEEEDVPFYGFVSSKKAMPRVPALKGPTAEELVSAAELPQNFDWRDHAGKNWVTSEVNQHIPVYCGGCWIHGAVLTLNDRIKIYREGRFPDVQVARQVLLNCVPSKDGEGPPPGCNGGDAWMVYKYLLHNKVPDDTCMSYTATNMNCTELNICRNCDPKSVTRPDGSKLFVAGDCYPMHNWTGYGVREHGNVTGELAMMKEIYARGPIACSIAADRSFGRYWENEGFIKEKVYTTDKKYTNDDIDHVMEVTGWGVTAAGTKYWVLRNSWGTYWGDLGWIRVGRGANQQMVESDCDWAVPDTADIDEKLHGLKLASYLADKARQPQQQLEDQSGGFLATVTSIQVLVAISTGAIGLALGRLSARSRGREGLAAALLASG